MTKLDELTHAQRQVLQLLKQGKTNAQIAAVLDRSEKTIKSHMTRLFKEFGCSTRAELIVMSLNLHATGGTPCPTCGGSGIVQAVATCD